MKTHSRGEDRMAGVGFKSGPLLPMFLPAVLSRGVLIPVDPNSFASMFGADPRSWITATPHSTASRRATAPIRCGTDRWRRARAVK